MILRLALEAVRYGLVSVAITPAVGYPRTLVIWPATLPVDEFTN